MSVCRRERRLAQIEATRHFSPERAAALGEEFYLSPILDFDDSTLLAAEPLLQSAYARTVARLAETSPSDRPGRALSLWHDRLTFAQNHLPRYSRLSQPLNRVTRALHRLPSVS